MTPQGKHPPASPCAPAPGALPRAGRGALPGPGPCRLVPAEAPTMARSLTRRCCPCCLTDDEKAAARIDQEINRILLEQKKRDRGELKLLLLGEWGGQGGGAPGPGPGRGWGCSPLAGPGELETHFWARRLRRREPQVWSQGVARGPGRPAASRGMCQRRWPRGRQAQPALPAPAPGCGSRASPGLWVRGALPPSPLPAARAPPRGGLDPARPGAGRCQWARADRPVD